MKKVQRISTGDGFLAIKKRASFRESIRLTAQKKRSPNRESARLTARS